MFKTNILIGSLVIGVSLTYIYYRQIRDLINIFYKNPLKNLKIHIISHDTDNIKELADEVTSHLSECNILGFDCEWVTEGKRRNPVALLQICTHKKLCVLIRLCKLNGVPKEFKKLLEDRSVLKVGVVPSQDASYLGCDYQVFVKSCFDLRHLTRTPYGLAVMAKQYLNFHVNKDWHVRCSDWEANELTDKQIMYAAIDALIAVEIFKILLDKLKTTIDDLKPYLDVRFSHKGFRNTVENSKKRLQFSPPRPKKPPKISTRKTPLYTNCHMQAPDGELLCTCDRGKAEWYISKKLADLICEKPFTIKLRFEPAGRAVGDAGQYYTSTKENQCVVCGRKDSYIRKNVVPREYRKFFPVVMKEHTSHDVLLLCILCHQKSNMCDIVLRHKLAKTCNAPIGTESDVKVVHSKELHQLQSAARALLKNDNKLPIERKRILSEIVLKHFPEKKELTEELLKEAEKTITSIKNENYESHGRKVVDYFINNSKHTTDKPLLQTGGLVQLERLWREHFLESMNPHHMPDLWSVSHNKHRLEIRAEEGRVEIQDLIKAGCHINMENVQ